MTQGPSFDISRIREIGWTHWDPISLADNRDGAEDEYDTYLLRASGMLFHDKPLVKVVDYLVAIESEHMGLGSQPSAQSRAVATVNALSVYVSELRP